MSEETISIKYPTAKQFIEDYPNIKKRVLFVPAREPMAVGTILTVNIKLPGIEQVFTVNGMVFKAITEKEAWANKRQPGSMIDISSLLSPFDVLNPISRSLITSPSISKMSPTLIDLSDNNIIPEIKSLKVCCKPSPIPTSKAAELARRTVTFTPSAFRISTKASVHRKYFII